MCVSVCVFVICASEHVMMVLEGLTLTVSLCVCYTLVCVHVYVSSCVCFYVCVVQFVSLCVYVCVLVCLYVRLCLFLDLAASGSGPPLGRSVSHRRLWLWNNRLNGVLRNGGEAPLVLGGALVDLGGALRWKGGALRFG